MIKKGVMEPKPERKIVITGATGTVGGVLTNGLGHDFNVLPLDHHHCDLTDLPSLEGCLPQDLEALVHLAWKRSEIYADGHFDPENIMMTLNVLEAAVRCHIPRVILASSVHVHEYRGHNGMISATDYTLPTSLYGATKVYLEEIGKYYARYRQLEVVAVRLGGVNPDDSPNARDEEDYRRIYLSHADLVTAYRELLLPDPVPSTFSVMYLVSENDNAVHFRDRFIL